VLTVEQELRERLTIDLTTAAKAAGIGRGLAYRLANQGAELVPGVPIWRTGHKFVVPSRPLRVAFGLEDAA
jgi:hypothetical protein